jgi:NDP-sugar pyrophosphorylase family protein
MTPPTLLVLAAGMGSRYGGLKQIDPIGPNGETIIDYSVYDALRAGFTKLVIAIRHDIEQPFKQLVATRFASHIPVQYVFQELASLPPGFSVPPGRTRPWGTAHAVLMAADAIHTPFAVINADDFYDAESYRLLAQHLQSPAPTYAMAGFILRNTLSEFGAVSRGVCQVTADGFLQSIVEQKNIEREGAYIRGTNAAGQVAILSGDEVVSMNMWGFTPQVFQHLREHFQRFLALHGSELNLECYLPSVINELVSAGQARVKVLPTNAAWFGVTYRQDRPRVVENIMRLIHEGSYPQRLWS